MTNWKYGLIKINHKTVNALDEEYCELVELFADKDGEYTVFCKARINSLEEFNAAHKDIEKDGVNTWFAENGVFSYNVNNDGDDFWDWNRNIEIDEEEEELYKVYGGD